MKNKFFSTACLFGASTVSLAAQTPSYFHSKPMEQSALADSISTLTQTALFTLLGTLALGSVIFIWWVWKSCADLKQLQINARKSFLHLLILVAGLSTFGSSCTATQEARAADIRAAQATENRTCQMNQQCSDPSNSRYSIRSPYYGYSNWQRPSLCRCCGQRMANVGQ